MNIGLSKFIPEFFLTAWAILTAVFFVTAKGKKSVSVRVFIVYSVIAVVLAALAGLEVLAPFFFERTVISYLLSCFVFLMFGMLHTYLIRKFIGLAEGKSFFSELAFTLIVGFLGAAVYSRVFYYLKPVELIYLLIFTSTVMAMLIPFFFYQSFIFFLKIPAPTYKKWYYTNEGDHAIDDAIYADTNVILLKFSFFRTYEDTTMIVLQAKVPLRIEFKKAFAHVISEHNGNPKNYGQQIQLINEYETPDGWEFFVEEKGLFWSNGYIDPDLTVRENELKENELVMCNRAGT